MTREEAIRWLEIEKSIIKEVPEKPQGARELTEAYDMAIEALQFAEHFDLLKEFQSLQEVVRCKDCRWFKQDSSPVGYGYCDGRMVGREVDYNDFCSYGERLCNYFGERREE